MLHFESNPEDVQYFLSTLLRPWLDVEAPIQTDNLDTMKLLFCKTCQAF